LKPLGGFDKDKRIVKLQNMTSIINVKFNIFDWNNLLLWNDLKEKISKELNELTADLEGKPQDKPQEKVVESIGGLGTVRRTPVKMRIKKNIGGSQVLTPDAFSKTMGGGFFKSPTPKKTEIARPKSSYKENRSEITEEEEEYLRATFHPEVKWKIL